MIRIQKSPAPTVLTRSTSRARRQTDKLIQESEQPGFQPEFHSEIYGHEKVKKQLIDDQHGKCCFCESKLVSPSPGEVQKSWHCSFGDVEHYRPKAGWVQNDGEPLTKPGYYWLAYAWANLFYSCQVCNQTYKRNYFPLSDTANRVRSHQGDLSVEDPLVLSAIDDVESEIEFFDHDVHPKTPRGRETIKRTGLDRDALAEARLDYLKGEFGQAMLRIQESIDLKNAALLILSLAPNHPQGVDFLSRAQSTFNDAKSRLLDATQDHAPFANMTRCYLRRNGIDPANLQF